MFDINGSLLFDRGGEQYWRAHDNVMTQTDAARDAHQRYRPGGAARRRAARYVTLERRVALLALVTVSPQPAVAQNNLHNQPYAFGVPTQPATPPMQTTPPAVPDTPRPDGEFVQNKTLNGGQFRLTIVGRYNARLLLDGGTLTMFPERWQPAQYCARIGDCRQIPMQQTVEVAFQPINPDMFRIQLGTSQRVNAAQ